MHAGLERTRIPLAMCITGHWGPSPVMDGVCSSTSHASPHSPHPDMVPPSSSPSIHIRCFLGMSATSGRGHRFMTNAHRDSDWRPSTEREF